VGGARNSAGQIAPGIFPAYLRKDCRYEKNSSHPVRLLIFSTVLHAADKIRIGYPDFNSSTFTLSLAHMKGFFQEEGLQAELIRIRSAVALPALTSGEIDYHTVVRPAVAAALRGIPVRVVACFAPGLTTAIIARPEFKTIQDLKGKTIGLNSIGGGLESTVRMMLKHYGIDPDKDVKFLPPVRSKRALPR
jgi:ABC-type nitrate/sulfonate/bicarbonate transport system substrate-binding protein